MDLLDKASRYVFAITGQIVEPESSRNLVNADMNRHRLYQRQHRKVDLKRGLLGQNILQEFLNRDCLQLLIAQKDKVS